jgi:carbon monoxide dehydrogenase subunit G
MAITVQIELERSFTVPKDIDTVFTLISNVPESGKHFPKVDKLTDIGDNCFRWELNKIGVGDYAIQTSYACKYVSDPKKYSVVWTPIKGEGNGIVSGSWTVEKDGTGTKMHFHSAAEVTLPLPGLLKLALTPVVKMEFTSMAETYIKNLKGALGA